jgi:hypothetical protein
MWQIALECRRQPPSPLETLLFLATIVAEPRSGVAILQSYGRRELKVSTKCVCHSHLVRCITLRFKQRRRANQNRQALSARRRDIESIQRVKKTHAPRRIHACRGRHGINHDRRLLSLELMDRPDPGSWYSILEIEHLRIVRRDDQNILQSNGSLHSLPIHPSGRQVLRWPGCSGVLPSPGNGGPEARLRPGFRILIQSDCESVAPSLGHSAPHYRSTIPDPGDLSLSAATPPCRASRRPSYLLGFLFFRSQCSILSTRPMCSS